MNCTKGISKCYVKLSYKYFFFFHRTDFNSLVFNFRTNPSNISIISMSVLSNGFKTLVRLENRNLYQQNKNRPYIINPPTPLKREGPFICSSCGTLFTMKYILTECRTYAKEWQVAGIPNILSEALNPENTQQLITFLNISKSNKLV